MNEIVLDTETTGLSVENGKKFFSKRRKKYRT